MDVSQSTGKTTLALGHPPQSIWSVTVAIRENKSENNNNKRNSFTDNNEQRKRRPPERIGSGGGGGGFGGNLGITKLSMPGGCLCGRQDLTTNERATPKTDQRDKMPSIWRFIQLAGL